MKKLTILVCLALLLLVQGCGNKPTQIAEAQTTVKVEETTNNEEETTIKET